MIKVKNVSVKLQLQNIQALRGVAALLVFLFHAKHYFNGGVAWGDILFQNGNIGVPIFFVLSGFLMVFSTERLAPSSNSYNDVKQFLIKRIIRIAPLYFFLTIVFLLLEGDKAFFNDGISRIIKVFLFIPIGRLPPLFVGWTLNYEMFFYLVFALSLLFTKRYIFLYVFFILLLFIPLFIKVDRYSTPILFLISNPLMLYFLLGVFLGNIYPLIKLKDMAVKFIMLFGIATFIFYYFSQQRNFYLDLIFSGTLIFSLVSADKSSINFPNSQFLNYLGNISYSIYLVHPIFLLFLPGYLEHLNIPVLDYPLMVFSLIAILTMFSSYITYELIEKRFTSFLKKRFRTKEEVTIYKSPICELPITLSLARDNLPKE